MVLIDMIFVVENGIQCRTMTRGVIPDLVKTL